MTIAQNLMAESEASAMGKLNLANLARNHKDLFEANYYDDIDTTIFLFYDNSALIAELHGPLVIWSVH